MFGHQERSIVLLAAADAIPHRYIGCIRTPHTQWYNVGAGVPVAGECGSVCGSSQRRVRFCEGEESAWPLRMPFLIETLAAFALHTHNGIMWVLVSRLQANAAQYAVLRSGGFVSVKER